MFVQGLRGGILSGVRLGDRVCAGAERMVSYLSFLVTTGLSHLVLEIFVCDIQRDKTDNMDHYYSWPPHSGGPANNNNKKLITSSQQHQKFTFHRLIKKTNW